VPEHLRQRGDDQYRYPHDSPTGWVPQAYLENPLNITELKPIGYEKKLLEHLDKLKGRQGA
jgi:replication-associated recombination protein RarA